MPDTDKQRQAFDFLLDRFRLQDTFTRQDFEKAVPGWKKSTYDTYWSKQIRHLLVRIGKEYRVTEAFRPYANWDSFQKNIVTQVRRTYSDYVTFAYDKLIIYEFYMPLSNEGHLRTALDALFYKDTILARLRTVGHEEVMKHFPINKGESIEVYLDRVCGWISDQFGGYSISHVSGRFRAGPLSTMSEVADFQKYGGRYLIDETTAVVRFIFPTGKPRRVKTPISGVDFAEDVYEHVANEPDDSATIRWFFRVLFVQSILQVVNGEDEIWMVESGVRNRLHIWRTE